MSATPHAEPFGTPEEAAAQAAALPPTPQTASPAFRLAFDDPAFLRRDEMRAVRLALEIAKPELLQDEAGITETVALFGSTRVAAGSRWYEEARRFAAAMTAAMLGEGRQGFAIVTGGGPGIMEAGNRGAAEAGGKTVGLSIVLPREQAPNPWITPALSFQFHYFGIRKMQFLMRARAAAFFPGGFGTLDELFETLTLVQTRKIRPIPILLFGRAWWERVVRLDVLVAEGMIGAEDAGLITWVETAEQGVAAARAGFG